MCGNILSIKNKGALPEFLVSIKVLGIVSRLANNIDFLKINVETHENIIEMLKYNDYENIEEKVLEITNTCKEHMLNINTVYIDIIQEESNNNLEYKLEEETNDEVGVETVDWKKVGKFSLNTTSRIGKFLFKVVSIPLKLIGKLLNGIARVIYEDSESSKLIDTMTKEDLEILKEQYKFKIDLLENELEEVIEFFMDKDKVTEMKTRVVESYRSKTLNTTLIDQIYFGIYGDLENMKYDKTNKNELRKALLEILELSKGQSIRIVNKAIAKKSRLHKDTVDNIKGIVGR